MNEFGKSLEIASYNISREMQEVRFFAICITNEAATDVFYFFVFLYFWQIDISSAKVYIDEYENDLLSYEFYR